MLKKDPANCSVLAASLCFMTYFLALCIHHTTVRCLVPQRHKKLSSLNSESVSQSCLGHAGELRVDFLIAGFILSHPLLTAHAHTVHRIELIISALCSGQLSSQEGSAMSTDLAKH